MEQKQEKRRGHFQRGRRGPDRRGGDRRPQHTQTQERPGRDQVDVEQIMRDIRSRIAQRHGGVDLSNQQIQDLAARRLESILDPRTIKSSLLDALRRTAGAGPAPVADEVPSEPAFAFEDTTIYDSHRGALRLIRRLLNPLLKLFFNPNPLIHALHLQAGLNVQAAERDADRDRQQAEWNALHYEIVQRLVTEVSQVSLELKSLSMRVESLDAKVAFNEQRVRGIEGSVHRSRPQSRPAEPVVASPAVTGETAPPDTATEAPRVDGQLSDGTKRRRRRRRGRRPDTSPGEATAAGEAAQLTDRVALNEPSAPSDVPAEPKPTSEYLPLDGGAASAPPETHAEPQRTSESRVQDSGVAPAPPETPAEPQPKVEHLPYDSGAASAVSETPAEPQPTSDYRAQDSGVAAAPPETPAEPQPKAEHLPYDSGAASALSEAPAGPPPTIDDRGQHSGVAPVTSETPAEPQPTVEHFPQDSGAARAPSGTPAEPQATAEDVALEPLAERPDADGTER